MVSTQSQITFEILNLMKQSTVKSFWYLQRGTIGGTLVAIVCLVEQRCWLECWFLFFWLGCMAVGYIYAGIPDYNRFFLPTWPFPFIKIQVRRCMEWFRGKVRWLLVFYGRKWRQFFLPGRRTILLLESFFSPNSPFFAAKKAYTWHQHLY